MAKEKQKFIIKCFWMKRWLKKDRPDLITTFRDEFTGCPKSKSGSRSSETVTYTAKIFLASDDYP
jgi:hypothetical protein